MPFPIREIKAPTATVSGTSGDLANVLVESQGVAHFADGHEEPVVGQFPAAAHTQIYFFHDLSDEQLIERLHVFQDFWGITSDLGKVFRSNWKTIEKQNQYWKEWSSYRFPTNSDGIWCELVFNMAWGPDLGIPLSANKKFLWQGVTFPIEFFEKRHEIARDFPELAGKLEELKPPLSTWYSEIDDFVSASQYALDYLISSVTSLLEPVQEIKKGPTCRIEVSGEKILLDGEVVAIDQDQAAFLQVLIENYPKPITYSGMVNSHNDLVNFNPAKLGRDIRDKLPPGIVKLIESPPGKGNSLSDEAWIC